MKISCKTPTWKESNDLKNTNAVFKVGENKNPIPSFIPAHFLYDLEPSLISLPLTSIGCNPINLLR